MFEAYKVGVTLSLQNTVSAGLLLIMRQAFQAQGALGMLQKSIDKMKDSGKRAAYELGASFAIASPFIVAISDAAKLQKEMIGIQSVTRGTAAEMNNMRSAIEGVAGQTIFSSIDVAKMGKTIAAGTGLDAKAVTALLPQYAKFADVQYILKGTPYEKSVLDAVRLAHTAGHYDSGSLEKYLDLLTKASFIVPGGLGEVGHALKYSQGIAKGALGIGDENMVLLTALLNRLGLSGSRGGTNLLAALSRSIPGVFGSGLLKGKSGQALKDMDMVDAGGHSKFFRDGKFDAFSWIQGLSTYVSKEFASHPEAIARQDILKNFQFAFGVQGARVASLLAGPGALQQLLMISKTFSEGSSTSVIQSKFADESVWQKFENARTNFTSAMTELGWVLLPYAAKGLASLNNGLSTLTGYLHDNPEIVKKVSLGFLGLSAALGFAGIVNALKFAFWGLSVPVKILYIPLAALGKVPFAAIAGGITAVTAALMGAAALVYYHKEVADAIDDTSAGKWVGDKLLGARDSLYASFGNMRGQTGGSRSYAAPPSANGATIHVDVRDPYHLAKVVTQQQAKSMSGPLTSGSGFDGRQSPIPAGASGSW